MTTVRTRSAKGSALTHAELDANFDRGVNQKTVDYQLLVTDNRSTIECSHASTPITVTLVDTGTWTTPEIGDFMVRITNIGAAAVTVARAGSDTINGGTSSLTLQQNESVTLQVLSGEGGYIELSNSQNKITATGDTAAGDAAAFGYEATLGAILTGQGSTNDVTIKNDADGNVIEIPTGTNNVSFAGDITTTGRTIVDDTTDSTSGTTGSIQTDGGIGAVKEIVTDATFKPLGDTSSGDAAAVGYAAGEGLILTGQGSVYDVTIKNDADAQVIGVPTGTNNLQTLGDLSVAGQAFLEETNYRNQVTDTEGVYATPIVLTSPQSGRVLLLDDAAGLDFTLPAITAGDIGMRFTFVTTVSVTSNNYRMTAGAGDILFGGLLCVDHDAAYTAPQAAFYEADGSDDLVITLNGGTTGGLVGTKIELVATSATQWFVSGINLGDGVLATPFS